MGTIADLYFNMGGKVIILGKPSKEIYIESTKNISKLDLSKIIEPLSPLVTITFLIF